MENSENSADVSTPKKAEIVLNALTLEESTTLREFILNRVPEPGSFNLPYRPDEWDSAGIIQKIQDLAKDHIRRTHVTNSNLKPKSFTISNLSDSGDSGEEYEEYNANDEILYRVTATVSNETTCTGGDTLYVNTHQSVSHVDGTTVTIHRCEAINNWKISPVDGSRLDLVIYLQENVKRISYNYHIDQIDTDIPDF